MGRSQGRITSEGSTPCNKEIRMVARSLHSAGNQAWSRPPALADPYLGAANLSHQSDGNCHRGTAAARKNRELRPWPASSLPARTRFGWNGEEPMRQFSIA